MTPNREDYLKLIFELGGSQKKISNKQIVSGLNVSAASVSEMISKLVKDGFVSHSPYQGVQLTDKGLKNASSLLRRHRLWEVFLVEQLGYSWNDVHEEAEILEHVSSDELTNRLDEYLNHPKVCPHGGIIPSPDQTVEEKDWKTILDQPVGMMIRIQRVLDEKELLDYLVDLDLLIGEVWTISKIEPYEGPIILTNDKRKIAVSQKAAGNIFVEPIKSL